MEIKSEKGQGVAIMTNGDNGAYLYNEIIRSIAPMEKSASTNPQKMASRNKYLMQHKKFDGLKENIF